MIHLDWDEPIHWNGGRRNPCTHCGRPTFLLDAARRPAHKACAQAALAALLAQNHKAEPLDREPHTPRKLHKPPKLHKPFREMSADLQPVQDQRFRGEQREVTNEDGATTGDTWSIEPATVTINTLTINGKQVTLDVFRQLKQAVLINHDGSLAGSPWGLVNYHQKRCDKLEKHAHVVWQLGDQLRQDTIQPPRWESTGPTPVMLWSSRTAVSSVFRPSPCGLARRQRIQCDPVNLARAGRG